MAYEPNGFERNGSAIMTTQYLSDWEELAEAQRTKQSARARLALAGALDRYQVPVVTLSADSLPPQAA